VSPSAIDSSVAVRGSSTTSCRLSGARPSMIAPWVRAGSVTQLVTNVGMRPESTGSPVAPMIRAKPCTTPDAPATPSTSPTASTSPAGTVCRTSAKADVCTEVERTTASVPSSVEEINPLAVSVRALPRSCTPDRNATPRTTARADSASRVRCPRSPVRAIRIIAWGGRRRRRSASRSQAGTAASPSGRAPQAGLRCPDPSSGRARPLRWGVAGRRPPARRPERSPGGHRRRQPDRG